jgi:hypothetical protein
MDAAGPSRDRDLHPPAPLRAWWAICLGLAILLSGLAAHHWTSSAKALVLQSQSFQLSGADAKDRLTVRCPGKRSLPLSGGMHTDPVGIDGEGVYPHSYERLGVQHGWHVTPVLFDPSPSAARTVTLQVLCGPRLGPVSSPHSTVFVRPGQSQTATATCPRGTRLFSGGFQRTNFITVGGNYATESRAVSNRSWQVSGSAFGAFGGELTAIVYCLRSRRPLVREFSGQAALSLRQSATATTPSCPPGSSLVSGGFSTSPSGPAMVSSAHFNPEGTWSSTAFNQFGPAATVSAHGYCMSRSTLTRRQRMRHGKRATHERIIQAPPILDAALKVAISERVSNNGCFPGPSDLVGDLKAAGIEAQDAGGPRAVRRRGVVHVLSDGASCSRVRLALLQGRALVELDSATGEVRKLTPR